MTTTREKDVVALLIDQHNQIKAMFTQLETATGDHRRELFEDLVRLLAVHETAEEEIVHPVARKKIQGGDAIIDARLREEDEEKRLLSELYDLGPDNPGFGAKFRQLKEAVLEHAGREEREEFSTLRTAVDPEQLRKMGNAVMMAEKTAPTRPHPGAPESAIGNLLAGPPLAVFDRIRDAMRDATKSKK
ncbi:hemerythrin domain-containing protein [Planosporangium thailandense]|uniref:Hemerythrin domain-containing protein n=1 Tax=Planosporangium thailandense TaxID=765197 RepID=A0ABX0Y4F2_9ACTN|nr:hemerythrin domain-containing protein [Planosporangium thailandense]NJC73277.1 hemerythrin domain-containing protein [Planosporangium thailandense]